MNRIHEGYVIDNKTIPARATLAFSGETLEETVDYLKKTGGIYKNILHNFQFRVAKEVGDE